jgi:hypothetical protein
MAERTEYEERIEALECELEHWMPHDAAGAAQR